MKKFLSILIAVMMMLSVAACGQNAAAPAPAEAKDDAAPAETADTPIELSIGHIYAPTHAIGQACEFFANRVNELSGGSVTVVVYPSSQMGSESEILQQVEQGVLDMTISGGGMYAGYNPAASIFESLCMFTTADQQKQIIEDMGGMDFFNEVMADSNFVAVGWMSGGARNVLSNVPVRSVDDFKGVNIRVPDNKVYVDIFNALGCNPTIVAWSEGYTAMQTGMVSAIEAGTETLATANLQEVAKYYTLTGHINVTNFCSMNRASWDNLSADQQKAVLDAMTETNEFQRKLSAENEQVYRDLFTDSGIEIITLPDGDMAALQQAVSGLVLDTAEQFGYADRVAELRSCLG